MINYKQALLDPGSVFKSPEELLGSNELSKKQKIKILHSWEYDARELQVAEEENMLGPSKVLLEAVVKALIQLGVKPLIHPAPTKQGGD